MLVEFLFLETISSPSFNMPTIAGHFVDSGSSPNALKTASFSICPSVFPERLERGFQFVAGGGLDHVSLAVVIRCSASYMSANSSRNSSFSVLMLSFTFGA